MGEIDLGRPRWQEEPLQIIKVLVSYLQIDDESKTPDAVFSQNALRAEEAIAQMERKFGRHDMES